MAGVQIDGVNNKIDFDDDLDTSISANTDDTLVFEIAGATDFTMTANTFTAASGSTIAAQALTATTVTASGIVTGSAFTAGSAVLAEAELELLDGLTAGTAIASKVVTTDANIDSTGMRNLTISGEIDAATGDFSGAIDVAGTANLDVVDIDGAVNMATTALVTGVLTTTAATVFNGGFTANDGSIITTADNTDTLTLTSTDADANSGPNLRFYRNSGSPADGDDLAYIEFEGRNDNSQDVVYGRIRTQIKDASDGTEDGKMDLGSILAGTEIDWLTFNPADPASVIFNEGSADIDFRVESDGRTHAFFVDAGTNTTMIGTSETDFHGNADDLIIGSGSGHKGLTIFTGNDSTGNLNFADGTLTAGNSDRGFIKYDHSTNDMFFSVNGNGSAYSLVLHDGGQVSTGGETAPDTGDGGLCLDQNANDINILTLKSSDIAHGMTDNGETDTYFFIKKGSATAGGVYIQGFSEEDQAVRITGAVTTVSTGEATNQSPAVKVEGSKKSGDSIGAMGADDNVFGITNHGSQVVLFKGDGEIFSDQSATVGTYDAYEDAQLVRAFDLNHMQGVINSKFDKFVQYNKDDLQKARLIGTDDDGNATPFVNITGMSRLHNGAIWQQYEKHQRLAEAVYEMAKETLGEDKADAILKKHDIKLLN